MSAPLIRRYEPEQLGAVLDLAIRAWSPVFPRLKFDIPHYVYEAFYPDEWQARQRKDVAAICCDPATEVWLAQVRNEMAGFIGLRAHPEDSMGEVHIIAVDPPFQRQGIGGAMLEFAFAWMRERALSMAMVETGDDPGHAPSRATYERAGFDRYPVARYFRKL